MAVDVVGVGIACSDVNITVTSIPKVDENVLVLDYRKHMGGTVSTALAALQRLGMQTRYMGMLGDDEYGRFTYEGLKAEGIDMSAVRLVEGERSPFSFVMVDSLTGRRSIAFFPGCAFTVPPDVIDPAIIQSAKLLHVDIPTPAVFAACEAARAAGVPVSLDANAVYPGLEELLRLTDIFITAREVTAALSGIEDAVESGKHILKEYDLALVVVTLGPQGSVAVTSDAVVTSSGFPIEVVDTTGAGDVFHGAYLYGHLRGWPIERALQFANAAGAIMCTTQIGWAGIPTKEQIEKFLRERTTE